MGFARLTVSIVTGIVAWCLLSFVFSYTGIDRVNPFTPPLAIGIAVAWALFAFVRS